MITHDLKCQSCGLLLRDIRLMSVKEVATLQCGRCHGRLGIIYLAFPGLLGVETGSSFKSGYDVQLGKSFDSRSERDSYVRQKGLVAMGPDEYRRTMNTMHDSEPAFDDAGFEGAAKRAWQETVVEGKVKPIHKLDKDTHIAVD
jgi:hypothetical protein